MNIELENILMVFFISIFVCFIIGSVMLSRARLALVPINAFHELAKFIISIKGDIYKNRFNMRINSGTIEDDINSIDSRRIGIKPRRGTVYSPFEIERFKASFTLKDGSVCSIALNQICLRVITTKRRSSGKTKTKMKRKHKFFHLLTFKLNAKDYKVFNAGTKIMNTDRFDIDLHTEGDFMYVKVKAKVKMSHIPSEIKRVHKHRLSFYTEIIAYLLEHKVMEKTANTKLN